MSRKKKNNKISEQTEALMQDKDITDVADLQSVLKEMLKTGVEKLLEAELDEELGYEPYDRQVEKTNYRNGKSTKRVKTDLGEVELKIPRDRNGEFDPQIVPKHSSDISAIEDKVISMYGKGMSQRDISEHIEDLYGMPLSAQSIFLTSTINYNLNSILPCS